MLYNIFLFNLKYLCNKKFILKVSIYFILRDLEKAITYL